MHNLSLRTLLRAETKDIHSQLDSITGIFSSIEQYKHFATNTYRFRISLEHALSPLDNWSPQKLGPHLRDDLHDLGVTPRPDHRLYAHTLNTAEHVGALYVLEGSSLGAQLLLRRAITLGLDAHFGARHLAQQVSEPKRWSRFVSLLETIPKHLHPQVIASAKAVFEHALHIYRDPIDDIH
jgi:heme oxygenase